MWTRVVCISAAGGADDDAWVYGRAKGSCLKPVQGHGILVSNDAAQQD